MPGRSNGSTTRRRALKVIRRDGTARPPRRSGGAKGGGVPRFPVVVAFGRGNATPRSEDVGALYRCGQWLAARRTERVSVVGHANKRDSDRSAASLARRRVAAVTKLLLLLGARPAQVVVIATPRLHTVWLGSTPRERLQRRVVVVFRHEPPGGEKRQLKPPTAGGGRAGRRLRERVAVS